MPVAPRAGAANAERDTGLVDAGATGGPTGGATAGAAAGLANGVLKVGFTPPGGLKPAPGRKGGLNAAAGLATGGGGFAFVSGRDGDSGARSATSSPPLSSGAARFIARGFLGTLRWQSILFETKICFVRETGATTLIAPHNTTTRATQTKQMSSNMARVETRAGKRKRERDAHAGEATPSLPSDFQVSDQVFRSDALPDPASLSLLPEWTCASAAESGRLDALRWLREHGSPWNERTCAWAAREGHFEVLRWAHTHGCPWDARACAAAANRGDVTMLRWLFRNGCPAVDKTACEQAAGRGSLDVLRCLRLNGTPWDAMTCAAAAQGGQLEFLKWARANGCDEVYRWALKHGCREGYYPEYTNSGEWMVRLV